MDIRVLSLSILFALNVAQLHAAKDISHIQPIESIKSEKSQSKSTSIDSKEPSKSTSSSNLRKITPELMYSYIDFDFDSTQDTNYNRYQGHSNVYSVGADHLIFNESTFGGIYYFRVDTSVFSNFSIAPSPASVAQQDMSSNTIFFHVLKTVRPQWYVDLAGAYGQTTVHTDYRMAENRISAPEAFSNSRSSTWFVTGNVIYRKVWKKFSLRANLTGLYSKTNTPSYNLSFASSNSALAISALGNEVGLIQESLELGYALTPNVSPFINGGLVQVVYFANSRALITSPINGLLPQINMNKDGFRVGGGVTFNRKDMTLRLEEKYYNAGGTFNSYQTVVAWEYRFD